MGRKALWITLTLMVVLVVGAWPAYAGTISGSVHDLSDNALGTDQICVFCHLPHNPNPGGDVGAPLWNHSLTTVASFGLYSSTTFDGGPAVQPTGVSKLCLSCHDNSVAVDSYSGAAGTNFMSTINAGANVGTDLSNDHPVSFSYATSDAADAEIKAEASITLPLFSGNVECASCHDVHNTDVPALEGSLLRITLSGSAICLDCHIK